MAPAASPYLRHRFPPEIITQCVLLYMRFPLSLRALEEMMLMRGVQVSYETIHRWRRTSGTQAPGSEPDRAVGSTLATGLAGEARVLFYPPHRRRWPSVRCLHG